MEAHSNQKQRFEAVVLVLVTLLLALYAYARFFAIPYIGFQYTVAGEIVSVYATHPESDGLHLGDHLVEVNSYAWQGYSSALRDDPFADHRAGELVHLVVDRDGETLTLVWVIPGLNAEEVIGRLINVWAVSIPFWMAGAATILFVRPRTIQRNLLAALAFVTAIWLLTGTISRTHAYESAYLMRAALWMSAPIYIHFHWVFPRPLRQLPAWVWPFAYTLAALGALAQWLDWLSIRAYVGPFVLGILGSLIILSVRFVFRGERRQVGLLFVAMLIAFAPSVLLAFSPSLTSENLALVGSLFALPILPGAYFYSIYRRQLAGLELRANRLISIYLFISLLLALALGLLPWLSSSLRSSEAAAGAALIALALGVLIAALALRPFQGFIERRVLGMPIPPEAILTRFAGRLSTSLTNEHLVAVLEKEVLPSLFIREAALVAVVDSEREHQVIPFVLRPDQVESLARMDDEVILEGEPDRQLAGHEWVSLSLPLQVDGEKVGLLLLGRKDPDDYYSQAEVETLQAVADQTAIALTNIRQAQRLRALHRADIEREESERSVLARELHDDILNRLAEVGTRLADAGYSPAIRDGLQQIGADLRTKVHDLRPPMLNLGLYAALLQLADDLEDRHDAPLIQFQLEPAIDLYPPKVEQHLFRIVQQACENTLRHAGAETLTIAGELSAGQIELRVRDDGRGFPAEDGVDLLELLQQRHFGLAGIYERAELIGAKLRVHSQPSRGTKLRVTWKAD